MSLSKAIYFPDPSLPPSVPPSLLLSYYSEAKALLLAFKKHNVALTFIFDNRLGVRREGGREGGKEGRKENRTLILSSLQHRRCWRKGVRKGGREEGVEI